MKYVITDRDIKEKLTPRQAQKFRKLLSYIISEEELTLRANLYAGSTQPSPAYLA